MDGVVRFRFARSHRESQKLKPLPCRETRDKDGALIPPTSEIRAKLFYDFGNVVVLEEADGSDAG